MPWKPFPWFNKGEVEKTKLNRQNLNAAEEALVTGIGNGEIALPSSVVSDSRGSAPGDLLSFDGTSFVRAPKGNTGEAWSVRSDGTVGYVSPPEVSAVAWGVKASNTASQNVTKLNEALQSMNTGSPALPNGGTLRLPGQGIILINAPIEAEGVGQLIKGSSAYGSVLRATSFTGEAVIIYRNAIGATINTVQSLEDLRIDLNNQPCHGVISDKPYDHIYWRNVGIYNIANAQSAAIIQPDPSVENKISQTILWENVYAEHKEQGATGTVFSFTQCQEANFIGCKAFGGPATTEPTSTCTTWQFTDCRGICTLGCSAAMTAGAGIKVISETRKSIGIRFISMTFESVHGKALVAEGGPSSEEKQIEDLTLISPRIEQTVGGIELKGVEKSDLETSLLPVTISSTCAQVHIRTEDTTKITDEGSLTTIMGFANAGEGTGHYRVYPSLDVAAKATPTIFWRVPGWNNFWGWQYNANEKEEFGFLLRHYIAGPLNPTTILSATTAVLEALTVNLAVGTAGKGLRVKEGANAKQGLSGAMVSGEVTVLNSAVTETSRLLLTRQAGGTNPGAVYELTRTAGTSFVIKSMNASDTGRVAYQIFEPA